jgi:acetyl-CoA C-acetyltransferase
MEQVVIAAAARTPIGKFGGGLRELEAWQLGSAVTREVVKRARINADDVDEVIFGNVLQAGQGMNPARQASVEAGVPFETPSMTINKVCASGLKAIILGVQAIQLGDADIVVAGGMESMSNAPYLVDRARWGYRTGHGSFTDSMILDGLWCSLTDMHMGVIAENLATRFGISREEQDSFALKSFQKAREAVENGKFKTEIVPVVLTHGRKRSMRIVQDETVGKDTSMKLLAKLPPAFCEKGTITAGNASGINDGAAGVLLVGEGVAQRMRLPVLARIEGYASAAGDPELMGLTPVSAINKALGRSGLTLAEIDLLEIHETFAVSSILVNRKLHINEEKLNTRGGIALGHPIGASGARILVTLIYALRDEELDTGVASICLGGGQAAAMVVRRI